MTRSLYIKIAAMLVCIALLGAGITVFTAPRPMQESEDICIVTSFYPVYIAARNVAGDIDGVTVVNMVDGQYGCLHDYQMSPQDRVTLERADVFVMNGAGAETFLDAALAQKTDLPIIDLSQGIPLLESGHVHDHEEEAHEHEQVQEGAVNDHLWVSPLRYRRQIENLRDGLIAADPAHAEAYEQNAAAYMDKIDAVWARMQTAAKPFLHTDTVLFHDSLAYLAEDLRLHVSAALNVGEDSGVATDTLAQAELALADLEQAMFLYDAQYDTVTYRYLQEIPQTVWVISADTCVSGSGDADGWIAAMTALCESLEAVTAA